jgi:hypothetical protein
MSLSGQTEQLTQRAMQHCIEPGCGASYGINERLYVCSRCGGLLDVEIETWIRAIVVVSGVSESYFLLPMMRPSYP